MSDWSKFKQLDLPKINYSHKEAPEFLQIVPQGLLFEKNIKKQKIKMRTWEKLPVFFETEKKNTIPFDLFSAAFYLISRYEEYLDFDKDEHGRFPAKESLAFKEGFIERPLVNLWVGRLKAYLENEHPEYNFPEGQFHYISSIDVDMAYCYKHKGIWRNLGGFTRELLKLDLKKVDKRLKVLTDKEQDPFDNFAWQHEIQTQYQIETMYFILLADHGKFDKNIDFENEAFVELIQNLAQNYPIGIHPSYGSNKVKKRLKEEIKRLEKITLNEVQSSRQHFLKLDIRETYSNLHKHGITEDHSMGYSEHPGFRASICTPFRFFDLEKNEVLDITIFPFAIMDVAYNRFLKMSVEETIQSIDKMMDEVNQLHGYFISVFHNESLSDFDNWEGWREVYTFMLKKAAAFNEPIASLPD